MKRLTFSGMLAITGVSFLAVANAAGAAPAPAKPAAPAPTVAAAAAEFKPPQSVFVLPRSPQEGRDPFFPKSMRPYVNATPLVAAPTNAAPVRMDVDLKFKGRSGTAEHPLAIVNNHTFETGEEAEVLASGQRIRVRCLEIRPDSVVMQIGPERRELHLKGELVLPTAKVETRAEAQPALPKANVRPPLAVDR